MHSQKFVKNEDNLSSLLMLHITCVYHMKSYQDGLQGESMVICKATYVARLMENRG